MERDDRVILGEKTYGHYAVSGGGVMIPTGGTYTRYEPIENPDYRTPEQKRLDFLRSAALEGMRGEFQLLLTAEAQTEHQRVEFHCAWYEIIDRYSARVLTRESDRLIAIAGIASFIERRSGRMFVAGVWEETLIPNLLWNVKSTAQPRPSSSAPTWSWASVGRGVETQLRPLFETEPFPTIKYLVSDISISQTAVLHEGRILNAKLTLKKNFDLISRSKVRFIPDISNTALHREDENLVYLPIIFLSWDVLGERTSRNNQQIHGIVLRDTNDSRMVEYERVGYFCAEENETGLVEESNLLRPRRVWKDIVLV
jgi:hypothetical protein